MDKSLAKFQNISSFLSLARDPWVSFLDFYHEYLLGFLKEKPVKTHPSVSQD